MNQMNFYDKLAKKASFSVIKGKNDKYIVKCKNKSFIIDGLFVSQDTLGNRKFIIHLINEKNTHSEIKIEVPYNTVNMDELVDASINHLNTLFQHIDIDFIKSYLETQSDIINHIEKISDNKLLLNQSIYLRLKENYISISKKDTFFPLDSKNHFHFILVSDKKYQDFYPYLKDNSYASCMKELKKYLMSEVGIVLEKGFIHCEQEKLEKEISTKERVTIKKI